MRDRSGRADREIGLVKMGRGECTFSTKERGKIERQLYEGEKKKKTTRQKRETRDETRDERERNALSCISQKTCSGGSSLGSLLRPFPADARATRFRRQDAALAANPRQRRQEPAGALVHRNGNPPDPPTSTTNSPYSHLIVLLLLSFSKTLKGGNGKNWCSFYSLFLL